MQPHEVDPLTLVQQLAFGDESFQKPNTKFTDVNTISKLSGYSLKDTRQIILAHSLAIGKTIDDPILGSPQIKKVLERVANLKLRAKALHQAVQPDKLHQWAALSLSQRVAKLRNQFKGVKLTSSHLEQYFRHHRIRYKDIALLKSTGKSTR